MSQLARQTEVAGQDVLLIGRKTRWQIERPRSSRALLTWSSNSEREYRRGAPARRNAVQEGTAIARGPASNGRVPGATACDARKDCALAGAAVGARRRQQQQEEDAAGEPERRSVSCGASSAPAI